MMANSQRTQAIGLAIAALLQAACSNTLAPAPERLAPWTTQLRDTQPEGSYATVYLAGQAHLVFVAGEHSTDPKSQTFSMIRDVYTAFDFDTVIVEGFPNSESWSSDRMVKWAAEKPEVNGLLIGGEAVPTIRGASDEGARLRGGEPIDIEIRDRLLTQGANIEDLLGFYTLRSVPQWVRESKIRDGGDPLVAQLIETELKKNRERLALSNELLPNYAEWAKWYAHINDKPFGAAFVLEEVGPLSDGPYGTNRVAALVSNTRAAFLHELIIGHLNNGERVLAVFGASHTLIHRPALEYAIGEACYVGTDMDEARVNCRS